MAYRHTIGQREGFTLIEMVVVVGITVLLVATLLPYSRRGEQQIILFKEQALLLGSISRAKALSIEKRQEAGEAICGWGVHLDAVQGEYILFADKPPQGASCEGGLGSDKVYHTGEGEEREQFRLDARVRFQDPLPVTDILFVPPEQSVYLDGCSPDRFSLPPNPPNGSGCVVAPPVEILLTLQSADARFHAGIRVNIAGKVSEE